MFREDSKISFRRIYAFVGAVVFFAYSAVDIVMQILYSRNINVPTQIAVLIGGIFAFYFGKRALDSKKRGGNK